MDDRLGARDLELLVSETTTAPRHNATVEILDPSDAPGFGYDALLALVADRLSFVPRYRQRIRVVPGRLANPVWVDDERFELEYHVRLSALPRPGSIEQLRDLVSRIVSRPLDRTRPLWEMYLVEGLADGRIALLTKTHQALVDGVHTVDLGQLLYDGRPDAEPLGEDPWNPKSPSAPALVLRAVRDVLTDVDTLSQTARTTSGSLLRRAGRVAGLALSVGRALTGRVRQERSSPLAGQLSQQRLVASAETSLQDFRTIRDAHGGTVNDVILTVVAGGLRGWLMTRAEALTMRSVRAVVPVSVIDDDLEATALGTQIAPHVVELPVGEPSPVVRLHQVSYSFERHQATSRTVGADRLAGLTGFAPATFHVLGSRVAAEHGVHDYALSVTNVPGPQEPRYLAGARLVASYPVHPLEPDHAVAVGVTSYDGRVFFGINADRDLVPDAAVLAMCFQEALDELLDTATGARSRAPRGRNRQEDQ